MKKNKSVYLQLQPIVIAIICFSFLILANLSYINYKQGLWENDIRSELLNKLVSKKSRIEQSLYTRVYYTRGVAAYVAQNPNISNKEFYSLAKEYMGNDSVIFTMSLSRNCIINAVYPQNGHEAAIGINLLEHPERKAIVRKTIETCLTFIAGPVRLAEGDTAFISYTPIFIKKDGKKDKFWGVTDIVLREKDLIKDARFFANEDGYDFAMRGYNGLGDKGTIFWGDPRVFENDPVTIAIDLPIGKWILAGAPAAGWNQYKDQDKVFFYIMLLCTLVISILIGMFTQVLLKIRKNERDLKAIFGSMDSIIVEYDSKGEYIKIAPTNNSILVKPENELLGKTVQEVFDRNLSDLFLASINKCLASKELVVIEYPLEINGEPHWFTARINYKDEDTVIFNAYDITAKKKDEEIILKSEISLKELNAMKDKFFSIMAHDLRNPVGTQKAIADLMVNEYDSLSEQDRIALLQSMKESTTNLYSLVEDLLEWSRSQSGQLVVNFETFNLKNLCNTQVGPFLANTNLKNIKIEASIPDHVFVHSDPNIAATILRNLISNAIKFTRKGGKIHIYSEEVTIDNQKFQKINVRDNGVGIKQERLDNLFEFGLQKSTYGTNHEKGSGLGLSLCKELAIKIGAQLSVSSEYEVGSTFSLILKMEECQKQPQILQRISTDVIA